MDKGTFHRLQRIAQRSGAPLIVTDAQGKEPVVIMPLDAYEALFDGADFALDMLDGEFEEPWADDLMPEVIEDIPTPAPATAPAPMPTAEAVAPEMTIEEVPFDPPMEPETPGVVPAQEQKAAETSVGGEEQFYLEPID